MQDEEASTSNSIVGAVTHSTVVQVRDAHSVVVNADTMRSTHLSDPTHWPLAREWDPIAAGVQRARSGALDTGIPPYVDRDVDGELCALVKAADTAGGLVLLVGDSAAGKSRAAFEAVRAVLSEHRVACPAAAGDLLPIIDMICRADGRWVLWLDDMDAFLGPDALDQNVLAVCRRLRVPVVATMRTSLFKIFHPASHKSSPSESVVQQRARIGARVLEMADLVELKRIWTGPELDRARAHNDDRLTEAITNNGLYGVAEYLVAGPSIWSEWQRSTGVVGEARGPALVAAAVDLARTGLPGPYPEELIVDLHVHHLSSQGGALLRPEPLPEAWTWASRVRFGATSPLLPAGENLWHVFPYLVDGVERLIPCPPVLDVVWPRAVEHAANTDLMNIAVRAAEAETPVSYGVAEEIWRPMSAEDHPDAVWATHNLGVLCEANGRDDEAREFFERAAASGNGSAAFNMAVICKQSGDMESARKWSLRSTEAGYAPAFFQVGFDLEDQGRLDEAAEWYRRGAELGEHRSATNLGKILSSTGRENEALPWYHLAEQSGDEIATYNIGRSHHVAGRLDSAEHWYRIAFDRGFAVAAENLGVLRWTLGDHEGAAEWFRRSVEAGNLDAASKLGKLFEKIGDDDRAEHWFAHAADAGHMPSLYALAALFHRLDRHEECLDRLQVAAADGEFLATAMLGDFLYELGRVEEAVPHLTSTAESGHVNSAYNLGTIYANVNDIDESARWYRHAAESGDAQAAMNLAEVLFRSGRLASAVWWVGKARALLTTSTAAAQDS
ncbi:tetratricopeptide repeat protein [Lentzea guizhouensis]|nr:tetratricopeptide repeat protein [Lentzea guizhouensis]